MNYSMLKKIAVATLLTFFTLGGAIKAQNLTVSGRVTDEKNGEAMDFVNVGLMRASDTVFMRGSATGPDGRFEIRLVEPGEYLLHLPGR